MRRGHHSDHDDILRDGERLHVSLRNGGRLRVPMFATDSMQASPRLPRVHDGTGDSGLAMHRPGFRVTDAPLSDELQRACDAYEHDLTTAWHVVPDAPKASGNDAMPVDDIETAYRLYAEEISQVWKRPG